MTHRPNLDRGLQEEELISVGSNVFINTEGIFFGWDVNAHANSEGWFGPINADVLEANIVDANSGFFNELWVNNSINFIGDDPDVRIDANGYFIGNSTVNAVVNASGFYEDGVKIEVTDTNPGGSNTNIQYNDSGVFSGSAAFVFNESTNTVTVGNSTVNTSITSAGFFKSGVEVGLPPGFFSIRVAQAADTDHDVTFSPGKARSADDTADIVLAAAITKQIDAAWAVGTNAGGLDTGTVGNSLFYYLWIIRRSDTGVVDALFSLSATAPTMPANYDQKQRVGWVRTNASANILAFTQSVYDIAEFRYNAPIEDVDTTQGTTSTTRTLSVPPNSRALLRVRILDDVDTDNLVAFIIRPLTETDATVTTTGAPGSSLHVGTEGAGDQTAAAEFEIDVNASSQVATRAEAGGLDNLQIVTKGAKLLAIIP